MQDDIGDVVLDALLDCLAFIELSDDRVVPPDVAERVLGDVAGHFDALDDHARVVLATMILARAAHETSASRKTFLQAIPADFGLVDDEIG